MHRDFSHLGGGKNSEKEKRKSKTLCPSTPCSNSQSTTSVFLAPRLPTWGGHPVPLHMHAWEPEDSLQEPALSIVRVPCNSVMKATFTCSVSAPLESESTRSDFKSRHISNSFLFSLTCFHKVPAQHPAKTTGTEVASDFCVA